MRTETVRKRFRRWAAAALPLVIFAALSGCAEAAAEPTEMPPLETPPEVLSSTLVETPPVEDLGADVRDFGAVGDAVYHHHFGQAQDEWAYRVGHYSSLEETTLYARYFGEEGANPTYTVVSDGDTPGAGEVCLSEVTRFRQKGCDPAVGDAVVAFRGADPERSVPATDDSGAFEAAIAVGEGRLYLPEGDYMVSQVTAAKIEDLAGPGRVWLKEWNGGTTYSLASGGGDLLPYEAYGWIDAEHFHDEIWRSMHWITCLPLAYGWQDSGEFTGNISPRAEYPFDENREHLNIWLTVRPAVEEERFPDRVTVCIGDMAVYYTVQGSREWHQAASGFSGGGLYHPSWSGENEELSESDWTDCGDWVEITLTREELFRTDPSGEAAEWMLHCWSANSEELGGEQVEYIYVTAQVWIKEAAAAGCMMCDIGSDMRTAWDGRDVKEGYIVEACDGGTWFVPEEPRAFYGYTVPDEKYDRYMPYPSPTMTEE